MGCTMAFCRGKLATQLTGLLLVVLDRLTHGHGKISLPGVWDVVLMFVDVFLRIHRFRPSKSFEIIRVDACLQI